MNTSAPMESDECPVCGGLQSPGLPPGLCSYCALRGALGAPDSGESVGSDGETAGKGPRFGDYELITEIARGGMGVVWKARQVSLDRVVAVKMILAGKFARVEEVARFQSEARAVATLRHPHIVAIHETGECEGQHYFSMEYVPGQTLAERIKDQGPYDGAQAAQFMARAEQVPAPHSASVSGKAWVNQILESNAVPTVWVTNRIEQIDPAFRRRFAYHLELKSPPPGAREQLVRKTLEGVPVSEALVARLTSRKGLTPAQIRTAVRFAHLAAAPIRTPGRRKAAAATGPSLDDLIERQLRNADLALGRQPDAGQRPEVTQYSLDMLNVESRYDIARIIEALKARGHGCLCFHGAPGTGKTALAEHIAKSLERPLMIRRASDLVSKFVGETEQQMAAMFREAEAEKAVLLLDEADSFLQDRRGAQRTYEVTEVNEMLQGMERFNGIFVCTTNLMDAIDQAALRRFTFKIKFKPLLREQRERMFVVEALAGDEAALTDVIRSRLAKLEQLCPGDFAAVKRQVEILAETLPPEEFLAQLEAEHRIKPEVREARGMGFTN